MTCDSYQEHSRHHQAQLYVMESFRLLTLLKIASLIEYT
jgi:hypothetical protein